MSRNLRTSRWWADFASTPPPKPKDTPAQPYGNGKPESEVNIKPHMDPRPRTPHGHGIESLLDPPPKHSLESTAPGLENPATFEQPRGPEVIWRDQEMELDPAEVRKRYQELEQLRLDYIRSRIAGEKAEVKFEAELRGQKIKAAASAEKLVAKIHKLEHEHETILKGLADREMDLRAHFENDRANAKDGFVEELRMQTAKAAAYADRLKAEIDMLRHVNGKLQKDYEVDQSAYLARGRGEAKKEFEEELKKQKITAAAEAQKLEAKIVTLQREKENFRKRANAMGNYYKIEGVDFGDLEKMGQLKEELAASQSANVAMKTKVKELRDQNDSLQDQVHALQRGTDAMAIEHKQYEYEMHNHHKDELLNMHTRHNEEKSKMHTRHAEDTKEIEKLRNRILITMNSLLETLDKDLKASQHARVQIITDLDNVRQESDNILRQQVEKSEAGKAELLRSIEILKEDFGTS